VKDRITADTWRISLAHTGYSLYFILGRDVRTKLLLPLGDPGPLPNTWFTGPTRVYITNGSSIGSVVLAQIMVETDRQTDIHTDHATSVAMSRICALSV